MKCPHCGYYEMVEDQENDDYACPGCGLAAPLDVVETIERLRSPDYIMGEAERLLRGVNVRGGRVQTVRFHKVEPELPDKLVVSIHSDADALDVSLDRLVTSGARTLARAYAALKEMADA